MYEITSERPEDAAAIQTLLDQAFGAARYNKPVYRFRDEALPLDDFCHVARAGGRVIASIRYWPIALPNAAYPELLLGPLVVAPDWAGRGVGGALMRQTLDMAHWAQHRLVMLVGDGAYYRRFGFRPASHFGLSMAGEPDRLLALALTRKGSSNVRGSVLPWRSLRAA